MNQRGETALSVLPLDDQDMDSARVAHAVTQNVKCALVDDWFDVAVDEHTFAAKLRS